MAASGADPWGYTPPLSLWKLVEQNVSPKEQEEIKSMLGTSLVETTLDLHNEVDMLLEIWREYQDETESDRQSTPTLAEPPHVRDRLVQEICFLAEGVREKSERNGLNPQAVFTTSRHNSQILDYAEETKRSGSSLGMARPTSARTSDGRQTPLSPSSQASSRADLSSTISQDVSGANTKLNYMQFGEVCIRLRETLSKEIEQLEADVGFLQDCLDNAADMRSGGPTPTLSREPSISELREERTFLEKELLSAGPIKSTPTVKKLAFNPTPSSGTIKSLGPITGRVRPTPPSSAAGAARPAPLRAVHAITPALPSPDHTSPRRDLTVASPDALAAYADPERNPVAVNANRRLISQNYDLNPDNMNQRPSPPAQEREGSASGDRDYIRRRDGSSSRRRNISPARVKVVPVGSILDPQGDAGSGRSFMPTPPPSGEKPQLSRPGSADRFRKMVMHYREAT